MSAAVFLVDPADAVPAGQVLRVTGEEARHAVTVRRLTRGQPVECVDGQGWRARGTVDSVGGGMLGVLVEEVVVEPPPAPRLTVVQAVPKGDRGETAVATLTEVGVDVVVPWQASRCVARWREGRASKGLARWRRTAREASKQARRAHVPQVADLADLAAVLALVRAADRAVVLHEAAALRLSSLAVPRAGEVVLVVGPEGGLTDEEVAALEAAGALACRLGPTVLRTSTAGTAAAAVVLAASGRWD